MPRAGLRPRTTIAVPAFIAALIGISLFALSYGQVSLGLERLFAAFFSPTSDPIATQIVRDIRLPRVLTGLVAGAALGVSGVLMQALFRNPLADAWSLGLVAGGQLGVALVVTAAAFAGPDAIAFLRAFQGFGLTAGAFIGVAAFAFAMAAMSRRVGNVTLLVVGLMLGFAVPGPGQRHHPLRQSGGGPRPSPAGTTAPSLRRRLPTWSLWSLPSSSGSASPRPVRKD